MGSGPHAGLAAPSAAATAQADRGRREPFANEGSDEAGVGEETRMMTRAAPLARGSEHAEAVLGRLNRLIGRHLPNFSDTTHARAPVGET